MADELKNQEVLEDSEALSKEETESVSGGVDLAPPFGSSGAGVGFWPPDAKPEIMPPLPQRPNAPGKPQDGVGMVPWWHDD